MGVAPATNVLAGGLATARAMIGEMTSVTPDAVTDATIDEVTDARADVMIGAVTDVGTDATTDEGSGEASGVMVEGGRTEVMTERTIGTGEMTGTAATRRGRRGLDLQRESPSPPRAVDPPLTAVTPLVQAHRHPAQLTTLGLGPVLSRVAKKCEATRALRVARKQ